MPLPEVSVFVRLDCRTRNPVGLQKDKEPPYLEIPPILNHTLFIHQERIFFFTVTVAPQKTIVTVTSVMASLVSNAHSPVMARVRVTMII